MSTTPTPVDQEFAGRTALVTGGASGIGLALAHRLAASGASVVVADYDEESARKAVAALQSTGAKAAAVAMDVTDPASVEAGVRFAVDTFGALHLAVNNAGIGGPSNPTGDYAVEDWNRVVATNLSGVFYSMRYELPAIVAAGGGAIVNMSSILGTNGFGQARPRTSPPSTESSASPRRQHSNTPHRTSASTRSAPASSTPCCCATPRDRPATT